MPFKIMYRPIFRSLVALPALFMIVAATHAQSLSQEVTGTAGNEMLTPDITLTYTIGEPAVSYWNSGNGILTEGFQQNEMIITNISSTPEAIDISIYPNPFSSSFTVDFNQNGENGLVVTDALGRTVNATTTITGHKTTVDMQNVASGIYFVSVVRNHQRVAVYRLVKSTL